ncbi:hypothetical protein M885DRAFT_612851 [Pelagophyceae sp. CCMP2097]|nr:hypothetical protein M885DRAFT_612851 [Pelagophyceae sp. CCMP2097]
MKAPLLRVVVCSSIDGLVPAVKRSLARLQVDVEIEAHSAADYTTAQKETWRNARVVLGDPGLVAPLVDGADSLEFLQSTWAGVDSLVEKSTKRDYVCGKVSGCFGPLMAEYVFAHLLWRSRSFDLLSRQDDEPEWRQAELKSAVRPLTGRKLGFLGAGNICRHVAKVGKAFGLETLALTSTPLGASGFDRTTTSVADVFASSDVVVSALPSTPATRYMLDGGVLRAGARAGKTPPLFINVGRGDFISESELLQALDAKWLDHAVLDVFASEPLAATSLAADVADLFAENLLRFTQKQAILYPVDWDRGY